MQTYGRFRQECCGGASRLTQAARSHDRAAGSHVFVGGVNAGFFMKTGTIAVLSSRRAVFPKALRGASAAPRGGNHFGSIRVRIRFNTRSGIWFEHPRRRVANRRVVMQPVRPFGDRRFAVRPAAGARAVASLTAHAGHRVESCGVLRGGGSFGLKPPGWPMPRMEPQGGFRIANTKSPSHLNRGKLPARTRLFAAPVQGIVLHRPKPCSLAAGRFERGAHASPHEHAAPGGGPVQSARFVTAGERR